MMQSLMDLPGWLVGLAALFAIVFVWLKRPGAPPPEAAAEGKSPRPAAPRLKRRIHNAMLALINMFLFLTSSYHRMDLLERGLAKLQRRPSKADAAGEGPAAANGGWGQPLSRDNRRVAGFVVVLLGCGLWLKGGAILAVVAMQEAAGAASFSILDAGAIVSPPVWAGLSIVLGSVCFWRGLRYLRGKQDKPAMGDLALGGAGFLILVQVAIPEL